jgi:hypothetical protein
MDDDRKDLTKDQLKALLAYHDHELKGGKVLKAYAYPDHAGEIHQRALVDFGIAGVKVFRASEYELAVAAGEVAPTLEMLPMHQLKAIAEDLKVGVDGRPNPVKLIVAIRAQLEADAIAEMEAEETGPTRSEVINRFGKRYGDLLIDAGYASLSSVAEASDAELTAIKGIAQGALKAIREALAEPLPA